MGRRPHGLFPRAQTAVKAEVDLHFRLIDSLAHANLQAVPDLWERHLVSDTAHKLLQLATEDAGLDQIGPLVIGRLHVSQRLRK